MSRIGKKPVIVPKGVEVDVKGTLVSVKGPKGQMSKEMPAEVKVTHENDQIICTIPEDSNKVVRAKFGLVRSRQAKKARISKYLSDIRTPFLSKLPKM